MIRHSGSTSKNERVQDWTENYEHKDNLEFFAAALDQLTQEDAAHGGLMTIGLLGQRDLPGVTLRHAQSVLRWDLRPSLWSHAFLVAGRLSEVAEIGELPIREVSIYSRTGTFPEPADNAVSNATLRVYADAKGLRGPPGRRQRSPARRRDKRGGGKERCGPGDLESQPRSPSLRLLGDARDLGQLPLVGRAAPNPLREGFPMFSSAFVEYCYEGVPLDLSPAASERNSAPEHLWNGALWWDDAFTEFGHPISGYCCLRDKGGAILDPHVSAPAGTAR